MKNIQAEPEPRTLNTGFHPAGLVLAAGASTRMGRPKALLDYGGKPLAVHQADVLQAAGCSPVAVVLGSEGERIAAELNDPRAVRNPDWRSGRVSSAQAGLRAVGACDGYLVLPLDTVGVTPSTVADVIVFGREHGAAVVRPAHDGRPCRRAGVAPGRARNLLAVHPAPELRLDALLSAGMELFEVADPAVLNNVNTPEDWAKLLSE